LLITQKVEHYEVQINKQNANAVERDEKLLPQYVNIKKRIPSLYLEPVNASSKPFCIPIVPHSSS
jgi:hypothetical protein